MTDRSNLDLSTRQPGGSRPTRRKWQDISQMTMLFAQTPAWVPGMALVLGIVILSLWYLSPNPVAFPMDDAYIHFIYAENLVEHGRLFFNTTADAGVGTTSLLWVLLLALGYLLGISTGLAAKVLGIASLISAGIGIYVLLRPGFGALLALVSAALVALSGHLLWFSLSGMETTLFLALGVLALLAYREKRWAWLGVSLGLLALTRPEGLALAVAIGLIDVWRHRGVQRGLLATMLITVLICGPWFGYLYWRTGHIIPTSGIGKRLSITIGIRLVTSEVGFLSTLGQHPALIYPALWLVYILEFVLGGMALPPPRIPAGAILGRPEYTFSIWALAGLAGVILPLVWVFASLLARPRRWKRWIAHGARRPIVVLAAWAIIHNLVYMIVLPSTGTASRYGAINHLVLWLVLAIGLFIVARRSRLWPWMAGGLAIIALANTLYWNGVYDANIEHMKNVRIAAARYIGENLAPGEICGVSDIGAMRYFSQRPLVDLCGLINPDLGAIFLAGEMDRYLVENGATCVIFPGRAGTTADGWFDHAAVFGLSDTSLFEMEQVAEFKIARDEWLLGYLPTNNYQATVTIYRLVEGSD